MGNAKRAKAKSDKAKETGDPRLDEVIRAYQAQREEAHRIWTIYDGQPNPKGASKAALKKVREKFGRALPKDYEAFLLAHDGWDGYEYDRNLLDADQILEDEAEEAIEINIDNMDPDDADELANVFVVGLDNASAKVLYYERKAE